MSIVAMVERALTRRKKRTKPRIKKQTQKAHNEEFNSYKWTGRSD